MQQVQPLKILKASAGSGKTFALTVHFLSLLLDRPGSYREILALTFTNKATAEMKSRILSVLEGLATKHVVHRPELEAYRYELLALFPEWDSEEISTRADQAYRRILHDYSRFSVMTIDGFSQQVIRGFTYELGLDSGFKIELNIDKVRRDLMDRLYLQLNERPELFDWVIGQILQRIEDDKSWDINRELYNLSGIIFSDDFRLLEDVAGREGNEHLFETVSAYNREWLETFRTDYQQLIDRLATIFDASGVKAADLYRKGQHVLLKLKTLRDALDDLDGVQQKLGRLLGDPAAYQSDANRSPAVQALYEQLDPVLAGLIAFLDENRPKYHLVRAVDANIHYLRLLKDMTDLLADWRYEHNAQLISDAQTLLSKIGRTEHGDPTFIWEKIGNRYRYFLFDEFQDTSHMQWANLLPLLINALGTGRGRLHEHLIVGDVKQSIYRWRNGDFRILLQGVEEAVGRAFHLPDTAPLIAKGTLETNFRSEKNVIEFNNYLYGSLPDRLQEAINDQVRAAMDELDYERHWVQTGLHDTIRRAYEDAEQEVPTDKRLADRGVVSLEFLLPDPAPEGEDLKEDRKRGPLNANEFREEACRRTFDQVESWLKSGLYTPGAIGILVRTNAEAALLVEYFQHRQGGGGMRFPVISGDALLLSGHSSVKALVAALRYMAYEGREYNSYLANLVFHYAEAKSLPIPPDAWFAVGDADLGGLSGLLPEGLTQGWQGLKQLPLTELVERLIGLFAFDGDAGAVPYLLAFRDVVARFVESGARGLQRFLEYWDEESGRLPLPTGGQSGAVEILTVHKSKGLAYDVVMIPFCCWSLDGRYDRQVWFDVSETAFGAFERIPLRYGVDVRQSSLFAQYYQEQLYNYMDALNGLYVATTRARERLWILAPDPTGGKEDKGVKVSDVGRLLFAELTGGAPERLESLDPVRLRIEGAGPADVVAADTTSPPSSLSSPSPGIALQGYPTSGLLSALLSRQQEGNLEQWHRQRISALFSNALHGLMAGLRSVAELESAVDQLIINGRLAADERDRAIGLIRQAWAHPELGRLLAGDHRQSNEQGIIDAQGRTWRPDKVFFSEQETVVVDFKLGPTLSDPEHIAQLQGYVGFLQQMELPAVRGYLYYFLQNELVPLADSAQTDSSNNRRSDG